LLAIAEDGARLTLQHSSDELGQYCRVLRIPQLPWTEDVEVAQADGGQSINPMEGPYVQLSGQLGHRIRRNGIGWHVFSLRKRGRVTVNRRRAGVYQASDLGIARRRQYIQRAFDVDPVAARWIGDGAWYGAECRLVQHEIH